MGHVIDINQNRNGRRGREDIRLYAAGNTSSPKPGGPADRNDLGKAKTSLTVLALILTPQIVFGVNGELPAAMAAVSTVCGLILGWMMYSNAPGRNEPVLKLEAAAKSRPEKETEEEDIDRRRAA